MRRESAVRAVIPPSRRRRPTPREARTSLPGNPQSPAAARRFVRTTLTHWTGPVVLDRLVDDAVLLVSELVTNAVVHAGTDVGLLCRLEDTADDGTALVVEISDHHPARPIRGGLAPVGQETPEFGHGLQLVSGLAAAWGITYRPGTKTVWARLPVDSREQPHPALGGLTADGDHGDVLGPRQDPEDQDWVNRGALTFLAEASDLLAGQLDEEHVAALAGQLLVPRLADWCAVWLTDEADRLGQGGADGFATGSRPARVWHGSENRIEDLRQALENDPPVLPLPASDPERSGPVPVPWPKAAFGDGDPTGAALAFRLAAGGRPLGTLMIGRAGLLRFPDEVTGLVEDFGRRVALAIGAARQYTRQATISRVLQRGLLPSAVAEIPGMRSALVYEPREAGGPGGDFYDVFPAGDGRWCFALGDVQGKGPEAAVVIGLARPWLRLLAREGYQVGEVLDRLNQLLLDDATEAADAAARALAAAGGPSVPPEGPLPRFLSVLYGELVPVDGGVRCTLASAGHPLPLVLGADGVVRAAAKPQVLLGVVEEAAYRTETFDLRSGETLLCVTDGVTERRAGRRQFDDGDGLATALAGCAGLTAPLVAERIRTLVHAFAPEPPEDDLALLVLQTV
ncbi:SpoIIE family protein phosphatase [Streptomyces sp. NPDC091292]|uniref:SpoIIE family protein phosphatase n=1 Tax=Streptomyces sp. NPDC091292 TaxID=3365991 RepID=UPI0037FAEFE6